VPETHRPLTTAALAAALAVSATCAPAQDGPSVTISDARLAVTQLAVGAGAALGALSQDAGEAIYLQSGATTLDGLARAVADTGTPEALTAEDGALVARLPLVVLQGAELALEPGESLKLDRQSGSYLLSLGRVTIDGADVSATGAEHPDLPAFRPFIAGVGQASLSLSGSRFAGLGYGDAGATAGVFVSGRGLLSGGTSDPLRDNSFDGLYGVTLSGIDTAELTGNRFTGMRGSALSIAATGPVTLRNNRFEDTGGAQALHLSGGGGHLLSGNLLEGGRGKGLRIDDGARDVTLEDNRVTGFGGSGVTLAEGAGCLLLRGNKVADNDGAGIRLREAGAFVLAGNEITGNAGPGIEVARQRPDTAGTVIGNRLAGNRRGVRGVGLARLHLARNDMGGQMPRLLSGDLDQMTGAWLRDSRADGASNLVVEGVAARFPAALRRDAADRAFDTCSQGGGA